ncbi:MAG: CBS domain-containing protein [Acidimicrobiales bacterium]|nr:CBS domain-containing protein [Acidimicrobiales bacterium]
MRVRDGLRRNGVTIEGDETVHRAAVLMEEAGVGSLVVLDHEAVVGVVTDRDLVRRAMAKSLAPDARIDGVMSSPAVTLDADADLHAAYAQFREHPIRRLVVTSDGDVVGVLTIDDLLINLSAQLGDIARPVTAETIFGQRDPSVPATR